MESNEPTLASVMKRIRTHYGYTQYRLSEVLDLDHSFLSRIESGKRGISRDTAREIVRRLDLPPLLRHALLIASGNRSSFPPLSRIEQRLADPSMDDDTATQMLEALEAIAQWNTAKPNAGD